MNNLPKVRIWTGEKFLYDEHEGRDDEVVYLRLDGDFYFKYRKNPNLKNWIVQRYTDRNDLDGKEMCEGDLVELEYALQSNSNVEDSKGVYEIYYEKGCFYLKEHKQNWFTSDFTMNSDQPLHRYNICRIIGNIFEDKELMV